MDWAGLAGSHWAQTRLAAVVQAPAPGQALGRVLADNNAAPAGAVPRGLHCRQTQSLRANAFCSCRHGSARAPPRRSWSGGRTRRPATTKPTFCRCAGLWGWLSKGAGRCVGMACSCVREHQNSLKFPARFPWMPAALQRGLCADDEARHQQGARGAGQAAPGRSGGSATELRPGGWVDLTLSRGGGSNRRGAMFRLPVRRCAGC